MKRIYLEWTDDKGRRHNGNIVAPSVEVMTYPDGPVQVPLSDIRMIEMRERADTENPMFPPGREFMSDREFLEWLRNRLIFVYDESPNVDFVQRLKAIIWALPEEVMHR